MGAVSVYKRLNLVLKVGNHGVRLVEGRRRLRINEVQMRGWWDDPKLRDFTEELTTKLREDPDTSDKWIKAKAKAEGVWEYLTNAGGFFMRVSERNLRQQAWLAHYLKARETLNMMGGGFPKDHPWLIDTANRGVKATQYLYNNANRPAFARTAIGRVFSRFQLYVWNSVRFRRDVFREAKKIGYDPGSREVKRLRRLMTADLFVMGLASFVPFSLFGASVPPPFQEFTSMAKWAFGDEDDEEDAFFGSPLGPASLVTPPAARPMEDMFRLMLTNDWQKHAGWSMLTWFPFGRLAKDSLKTMENPHTAAERLTGIPVISLSNEIKEERGEEKLIPGAPVTTDDLEAAGSSLRGVLSRDEERPATFQ
jgi:hypothetical protein